MSDSLKPEALTPRQLPVVFTPGAWQYAVQLEHSRHPAMLQIHRLSHVLRAAFKAHKASPHQRYVVFEVTQIGSTGHSPPHPRLQLGLHLLLEQGQPDALLIACVGEHP